MIFCAANSAVAQSYPVKDFEAVSLIASIPGIIVVHPTLPVRSLSEFIALAVTSKARTAVAPALPTVAESGLPGYEYGSWMGVVAPAGAPREIIVKLNGEIVRILKSPEMLERLANDGAEVIASTPEEFANYIKREVVKWAKAVKDSGVRLD